MPSRLFPYAFLLSIGFISTSAIQDIRYYQDLIPDISPEDQIALKLERLLKVRNQNTPYGSLPFPHLNDFGVKEQQRREYERQALQDALSEKSNVIHKRRQQHVPNYPSSRTADHGLEENPSLREYAERDPREFYSYFHPYPGDMGPLTDAKPQRQTPAYPSTGHRSYHNQVPRERGMKEVPLMEFLDHRNQPQRYSGDPAEDRDESVVDFTYRFGPPNYQIGKFHFALRPNDPDYNSLPEVPAPALSDPGTGFKEDDNPGRIPPKNENVAEEEKKDEQEDIGRQDLKENETQPEPIEETSYDSYRLTKQINSNNEKLAEENEEDWKEFSTRRGPIKEPSNDAEPEVHIGFERRADNHSPSVTAVDPKISNDIYFVAVVAGCSAAAMFILVLISLTWCRLQRGAKAAADVEYPAYGVTGPNKDTSPSGDRRLAQSAQMYHYQHQKQQIIAMESRTATARDPGSVSEAESDEENEEGDYTVYECPGLAPTGEMEVKNPLFHDDPTPATPAGQGQNNRSSEDHDI